MVDFLYTPTTFVNGTSSQVARNWRTHYQLLFDGWRIQGDPPYPPGSAPSYALVSRSELIDFREEPVLEGFRDALAAFVEEAAGSATSVVRKGAANCAATTNPQTFAHGAGSADVQVEVYESGSKVFPDVTVNTTNIVIDFGGAPAASQYRVVWHY